MNGDTVYTGYGDNSYVPMDWNDHSYFQLKLIYKFSPLTKIRFTRINDNKVSQYYDRMYKYNPDGALNHNDVSTTNIFQITKNFNKNTFILWGLPVLLFFLGGAIILRKLVFRKV